MLPEDQLDSSLVAFRDLDVTDGPPPELVARTLAALNRERSRLARPPLLERLRSMPTLLRIAAAVLVSAGTFGVVTSGRNSPGVAFADALEQVRAARTVTYTAWLGSSPDQTSRVSWMEPGFTRIDSSDGGVNVHDDVRGRYLALDPELRQALVADDGPGDRAEDPRDPFGDLIGRLREFRGKPDADLGEREFGGRPARGYRLPADWNPLFPDATLWVDARSAAPIRLEAKLDLEGGKSDSVVFENFMFDAPLDQALFRFTPPAGYKIVKQFHPDVDPKAWSEKDFIDMLRAFARNAEGQLPDELDPMAIMFVMAMDVRNPGNGTEAEIEARIVRVLKAVNLVPDMPAGYDAAYTGKGVRIGQADRPVFRYRPEGSKTYRVIYGDLTVKDVEPDKIPNGCDLR